MPILRVLAPTALAVLAVLANPSAHARASILSLPNDAQPVNVSVGFNSQLPLPDLSQQTLADAQEAGRRYIYGLGRDECALLIETIAKTCRLTNLNINTQIQQHNPGQPHLYINGSATFTITLQDAADGGE